MDNIAQFEVVAQKMANAALVYSQAVAASATIESMRAANMEREQNSEGIAYTEDAFAGVIGEFQLGWNSVINLLNM